MNDGKFSPKIFPDREAYDAWEQCIIDGTEDLPQTYMPITVAGERMVVTKGQGGLAQLTPENLKKEDMDLALWLSCEDCEDQLE